MRYRLVTIGKDGYLAAYPEANSFFDNYELLQEYLKDNEDKLELSNYDSMVHESAKISHKYRLLSRLQSDCEHYLSEGERNAKHLYADTEQEQIQLMREIYQSFSEKERPEWISIEDINRYADQMLPSGQLEEPAESKSSLEKWQETLHETEIKESPHDYGTYQYRKSGRTK